jgi:hypothetical protein
MATPIKRHITFDPVLILRAERRARQYGVNFPEYIRLLIVNDTKPIVSPEVEMLNDPELEKSLGRALEDMKSGRVKEIEDIDEYVKNLK